MGGGCGFGDAALEKRVSSLPPNECRCSHCLQAEDHPDKRLHQLLNLLLSHLNEQERRCVAAYEARRLGWGGTTLVSLITGLSRVTIIRGQWELDDELRGRPSGRARLPGGGRHPKLAEDHVRLLKELLSEGATAHGWRNNLWTAKRVAKVIRKHPLAEVFLGKSVQLLGHRPETAPVLWRCLFCRFPHELAPMLQRVEAGDSSFWKWHTVQGLRNLRVAFGCNHSWRIAQNCLGRRREFLCHPVAGPAEDATR